jgi:two-component system sensor histidine kinase YesM
MKIVEKGDFDVKLKLTNRNEIGELCKTFNKMTRKVNKLINEVFIEKIRQKDLELQMLQNQINPHFLYNTLESIHMIAETNRDEKISIMAQSLGRILRFSISMKQDRVTIQEELNHLIDYIALQKVRFNNLFDITVNIDESIYKNLIIKMILQPIVENSIYHGLENIVEGGRINISGYVENSFVIFEIIDNGTGMDKTQVTNLNDYINGYNNFYKSIGLKNVNKRIKLYYGAEYGIEIFSTMGEGTKVKVILPCIEGL